MSTAPLTTRPAQFLYIHIQKSSLCCRFLVRSCLSPSVSPDACVCAALCSNGVAKRRWVQIKSVNGGRQGDRRQGAQAMVCEPLTLEWLEPSKKVSTGEAVVCWRLDCC